MGRRSKRSGETVKEIMDNLLDELDEDRAKGLREVYGLSRWVLSWMVEGGAWMARISGPGYPDTIERTGRTRVAAIKKAAAALKEVLSKA